MQHRLQKKLKDTLPLKQNQQKHIINQEES